MKVVNKEANDWDDHIQSIAFAYRVNRQESTKFTPFELMYGVKARLPIDLEEQRETNGPLDDAEELRQRAVDLAESLSNRREEAKTNIAAAQHKQKERYDIKHSQPVFAVGDKVLRYDRRRDTRMGDKLVPRFTGPYEIIEALGKGTYRLQLGDKVLKQTVNGLNLKRWFEELSPAEDISERSHITSTNCTPPVEENHSDSQPDLNASPWWVRTLNLNENDRRCLLSGEWLTDKLMDAVNRLIAQHLGNERSQTTLLSQMKTGFSPIVGEGIQLLHDNNHWVATACISNEVLYADSLNTAISEYVKRQMRQLYSTHITTSGNLKVSIIPSQRQPNMSDCGVFAAAFAFQWALGSKTLHASYDVEAMRLHLARCLENQAVEEFPTLPVKKRGRPKKEIIINV